MNEDKEKVLFADAFSTIEKAKFVILGICYERTTSHRKGTASAPDHIRDESYNFETYNQRLDVDLDDLEICDLGNIEPECIEEVEKKAAPYIIEIMKQKALSIFMGGEHSITAPVLKAIIKADELKQLTGMKFVCIDAHLDFRESYLDDPNSHACVTRRVSELIGAENCIIIGGRSMEKGEKRDADRMNLSYRDPFYFSGKEIIDSVMKFIGNDKVYLSIDMDGLDPAYAPGVGTPEPMGLDPITVMKIIQGLGKQMIGLDVVEIFPNYDNGNTSSLAAKFIREAIASKAAHD